MPEQQGNQPQQVAPAQGQLPAEKKPSKWRNRLYGLKRLFIDVPLALFAPAYYLGYKAIEGIYHMYKKDYKRGVYDVAKGGAQYGLSYTKSLLGMLIPGVDTITGLYEAGTGKRLKI